MSEKPTTQTSFGDVLNQASEAGRQHRADAVRNTQDMVITSVEHTQDRVSGAGRGLMERVRQARDAVVSLRQRAGDAARRGHEASIRVGEVARKTANVAEAVAFVPEQRRAVGAYAADRISDARDGLHDRYDQLRAATHTRVEGVVAAAGNRADALVTGLHDRVAAPIMDRARAVGNGAVDAAGRGALFVHDTAHRTGEGVHQMAQAGVDLARRGRDATVNTATNMATDARDQVVGAAQWTGRTAQETGRMAVDLAGRGAQAGVDLVGRGARAGVDLAGRAGNAAVDTARNIATDARDQVVDAAQWTGQTARETGVAALQTGERVVGAVGERMQSVRETATGWGNRLRGVFNRQVDSARNAMSETRVQVAAVAHEARAVPQSLRERVGSKIATWATKAAQNAAEASQSHHIKAQELRNASGKISIIE